MGYYIEVPNNRNKAEQMRTLHNAQVILQPKMLTEIPKDKALICVVENGTFDAAAIVFNQHELDDFIYDGTTRRKTWMLIDKQRAFRLCPRVEKEYKGESV